MVCSDAQLNHGANMSHAYHLLGIPHDASETDIKRAYARKLKTTRPDDDPAAFQQLNEAYQAALEECRWRVETASAKFSHEEEPDEILQAATPAPPPISVQETLPDAATPQPAPQFHYGEFLQALETAAQGYTPTALVRWLQQQPALYNLQLKHAVGHALHSTLHQGGLQSVSNEQLYALADFFGFSLQHWLLERRTVESAIKREVTTRYGEPTPMAVRQLKRPFRWPRALLHATVPGWTNRIARLGRTLHGAYEGWPENLNHEQYRFFAQLLDPNYFGRWRWAVMVLRACAAALFFTLFAGYLALVNSSKAPRIMLATFAISLVAVVVVQLIWTGMRWLQAFRAKPRPKNNRLIDFLPVWLALTALALNLLKIPYELIPLCIAAIGVTLTINRRFELICFGLSGCIWANVLMDKTSPLAPFIIGLACVPLAITGFDAIYARYHRIPLKAAAGNRLTRIAALIALFNIFAVIFLVKNDKPRAAQQRWVYFVIIMVIARVLAMWFSHKS
jgi:hypothetical protein